MSIQDIHNKWHKIFLNHFSHRFLPSIYVFCFDVITVLTTYFIAYAIRLNLDLTQIDPLQVFYQSILVTSIYAIFFILFRSYSGIIRHTSFTDAIRILKASSGGFTLAGIAIGIIRITDAQPPWNFSLGVLIIHFLTTYFLLMVARITVRTTYFTLVGIRKKVDKRVIIYGAGGAGMLTKNTLIQDPYISYTVVGFVDDNPGKAGKRLEGAMIYSPEDALNPNFIKKEQVDQLIIAIQELDREKQKSIVESALDLDLEVKTVPSIEKWINGQLSSEQIRKIEIEELLQRDTIKLDSTNVAKYLYGKVVMITGGAGSIGSGIVKQVLTYRPARLIILDQAESAMYDLQTEVNSSEDLAPYSHLAEYVIANIKDRFRMQQIFETFHPEIIFHAAAYKHVPLMESNPYEALLVNVFGTKNLADLSVKYEVKKFVMISTDKAVNPTNVMGASKRIAEILTQALSNGTTQFITTRFGNVLDSNGSVVPLFRKQIERGGPVTVTHKEITRFFMTIPEACSLVLEAGAMGDGGEIFVFDMGQPVKIYDLACKMIKLSGYELGNDIEIKEIGLRPGEKLYEELLNNEENTLPTYHPKILKARVREYNKKSIENNLNELTDLIIEANIFNLVSKMKDIVPEFISKNSIYDVLDSRKVGS
ncbi:MAG: nucleoside-diphosphate sugar epimerase/dehydratase [Perlabentimonas sp.]